MRKSFPCIPTRKTACEPVHKLNHSCRIALKSWMSHAVPFLELIHPISSCLVGYVLIFQRNRYILSLLMFCPRTNPSASVRLPKGCFPFAFAVSCRELRQFCRHFLEDARVRRLSFFYFRAAFDLRFECRQVHSHRAIASFGVPAAGLVRN